MIDLLGHCLVLYLDMSWDTLSFPSTGDALSFPSTGDLILIFSYCIRPLCGHGITLPLVMLFGVHRDTVRVRDHDAH
jgi:hypothetical protein